MNITEKQYKTFSKMVYAQSGINLHAGKKELLMARLSKRLRQTGIESVEEYLRLIQNNNQELTNFLNVISTNHTFFFRESHQFECIQKGHSSIWCAASSSGEEPYSVAIDCLEKGFRPSILATDISTKVLQIGERGIYPIERAKEVAPHLLRRYFQKGHGKWDGYIKVKDELKRIVTFKRFNLFTDPLPVQAFDVVLCRNVLIYFDNAVKGEVVNKLYSAIRQDGYFIIGGAESLNNLHHGFRYIRPSIYKKTGKP
jgi:chemotaxis protein methyltransferase CheR